MSSSSSLSSSFYLFFVTFCFLFCSFHIWLSYSASHEFCLSFLSFSLFSHHPLQTAGQALLEPLLKACKENKIVHPAGHEDRLRQALVKVRIFCLFGFASFFLSFFFFFLFFPAFISPSPCEFFPLGRSPFSPLHSAAYRLGEELAVSRSHPPDGGRPERALFPGIQPPRLSPRSASERAGAG